MQQTKARFEALLATAVDGIIVIDAWGVIEIYNPACERLFGYKLDEVLGQNVKLLMPMSYRHEHDAYIAGYHATGRRKIIGIGREVQGRRKDGTTFPMYLSVGEGHFDGKSLFVGIIHDVSGRKESERRVQEMRQELLHISRLSEMGQMASALAHELNQPLAAVTNYLNAARRTAGRQPVEAAHISELLEKAAGQALRAGQIIRRLREFTEKTEAVREQVTLNTVVQEAVDLALVGSSEVGLKVQTQYAADLPQVMIDRIQIQQVILNLVRNAIEAMRDCVERRLSVSTLSAGDFIEIHVADTGSGLAPHIAEKLFQPFVTSKPAGMGIGLSISRSIIDAHHGRLWVTPNQDAGVTFAFRLPVRAEMEPAS